MDGITEPGACFQNGPGFAQRVGISFMGRPTHRVGTSSMGRPPLANEPGHSAQVRSPSHMPSSLKLPG